MSKMSALILEGNADGCAMTGARSSGTPSPSIESMRVENCVVGHGGRWPQSIVVFRRAILAAHSAQANFRHREDRRFRVVESSRRLCVKSITM